MSFGIDLILNGKAHGDVADRLALANGDPGVLRPFIGKDGRSYITINTKRGPKTVLTNANSTLRYDEYKEFDKVVLRVARDRLGLVADIRGSGLEKVIPNGMGKTVLQHETMTDPGEAGMSMDALVDQPQVRPLFNTAFLPLPIVHADFSFSLRDIMASRNGDTPLDTTGAEIAARRVAERIEQQFIGGTAYDYTWGGGTIQGITTFTNRNTKTITSPAASGWTPATLVQQILQAKLQLHQDNQFGSFRLYAAQAWDVYLDDDYSTQYPGVTLRDRLLKIDGLSSIRTLDYLTGTYDMVLVQMVQDTIRAVVGMEMQTVQWESKGGLQKHFKVMAIIVPQIRADASGQCGIVHCTV